MHFIKAAEAVVLVALQASVSGHCASSLHVDPVVGLSHSHVASVTFSVNVFLVLLKNVFYATIN